MNIDDKVMSQFPAIFCFPTLEFKMVINRQKLWLCASATDKFSRGNGYIFLIVCGFYQWIHLTSSL